MFTTDKLFRHIEDKKLEKRNVLDYLTQFISSVQVNISNLNKDTEQELVSNLQDSSPKAISIDFKYQEYMGVKLVSSIKFVIETNHKNISIYDELQKAYNKNVEETVYITQEHKFITDTTQVINVSFEPLIYGFTNQYLELLPIFKVVFPHIVKNFGVDCADDMYLDLSMYVNKLSNLNENLETYKTFLTKSLTNLGFIVSKPNGLKYSNYVMYIKLNLSNE